MTVFKVKVSVLKKTEKKDIFVSGCGILSAKVELERLELIATIVSDPDGPAPRKLNRNFWHSEQRDL